MGRTRLSENGLEVIIPAEEPEHEGATSLSRSFGIRSWLQDMLETLLLALIIFLVINTLTGRYQVHGQSMEPSLYSSQYLIASKITYWLHSPERGDIVVLHPPEGQGSIPFIKRVIGVPGDIVEAREGKIWVNGIVLNEPYISAPPAYTQRWIVSAGMYLVLGDNRNHSSDSHAWGLLARESIIGKAVLCYWPPEHWGPIPHYSYEELQLVH